MLYGVFVREVLGYDGGRSRAFFGSARQGVVGHLTDDRCGDRCLFRRFRSANSGGHGSFEGWHRPSPIPPPSRASMEGLGLIPTLGDANSSSIATGAAIERKINI